LLSGTGDVVEPDGMGADGEGIVAIGSGGNYALAAGRALLRHTALSADEIAREALRTAAEICVYTNDRVVLETLPADRAAAGAVGGGAS
jgi:ATP-dependent HslUV protease subunit HslV